ncbi:uncharacterized mitochondrial protein AtMg00810-like [Lycium ferocissimum]|uniref:uncharacterized mitochondrial protein AtMg00810-like n=1 Tax=Lycium ferocissimum TaxID=112874 RepID=UPI0028152043|nr:uncharacterized mitochondrial protein AtMg00810-like [Lycium ferocissimum]
MVCQVVPGFVFQRVPTLLQCSLFKRVSGDSLVILAIYVDDITLTGTDLAEISDLKSFLQAEFKIKNLGSLNYFLGIEVLYTPSGVVLHQKKFLHDLLTAFHSLDCSSVVCPVELNAKLKAGVGDPLPKPEEYRWTSDFGIIFNSSSDLSLVVYCDSDWGACVDSRRSVSSFCVLLGSSVIGWKSKKQAVVSLSSAEVEYKSMSKAVAEITWVTRLLSDFGLTDLSSIPLFGDNQ